MDDRTGRPGEAEEESVVNDPTEADRRTARDIAVLCLRASNDFIAGRTREFPVDVSGDLIARALSAARQSGRDEGAKRERRLLAVFEPLLIEVEAARTERRATVEAACKAQQEWADAQPPSNNRWAFMTEFRAAMEREHEPLNEAVRRANAAFNLARQALDAPQDAATGCAEKTRGRLTYEELEAQFGIILIERDDARGERDQARTVLNECWEAAGLLCEEWTQQPWQAWEKGGDLVKEITELADRAGEEGDRDALEADVERLEAERDTALAEAARLKADRDRLSAALSEVRRWAHDGRVKLRETERENAALIAAWPEYPDTARMACKVKRKWCFMGYTKYYPSKAAAVRAAAKLSATTAKVATGPASGGGGESR